MDDCAAPLTPVRGFLAPLHLEQHRDLLKTSGYDDPPDFANFSSQDVSEMRAAL